jgi:type II secretory ATPase GspE/PulE/Tfp pilus assembly ATPase PilB-like protein
MSLQVVEYLVKSGAISQSQAQVCTAQQRQMLASGVRVELSALITRNRFAHARVVAQAYAAVHGASTLAQSELLSAELCVRLGVIPVSIANGILTIQAARRLSGSEQLSVLASATQPCGTLSVQAIDRVSLQRALAALTSDVQAFAPLVQKLRKDPSGGLLRQALDALLAEAVRERASDIRLERKADPEAWVSFRVDGVLRQRHLLPAQVMSALVTRIKTEAGMDASNTLSAQDGRLGLQYQNRQIDYRVNAQPIVNGETLALRVLDAAQLPTLSAMYPSQPEMQDLLVRLAEPGSKKGGIILISGATGSGKSTTLYALTQMLPRDKINLMTVEDPVEYTLPFSRQIQLNALLGQTAGDMERSLLRQDPDVILLGEIRDAKSARAGLKFAESGHLVLATLHASSATQIFERLAGFFDTNTEKEEAIHVLAQHLLVSMHQELVPKLCTYCAIPQHEAHGTYKRLGCNRCHDGIQGRALLHETLIIPRDKDVRASVQAELATGVAGASKLSSLFGIRHISKKETANALYASGVIDLEVAREAY